MSEDNNKILEHIWVELEHTARMTPVYRKSLDAKGLRSYMEALGAETNFSAADKNCVVNIKEYYETFHNR